MIPTSQRVSKLKYFFVSVGEECSISHALTVGTVQGSIIGPIIYAIFVSPLFDLARMAKFADFIIKYSKLLMQFIVYNIIFGD